MNHLSVLPGGRVEHHDPNYWLHPVHQKAVNKPRAVTPLEAHFATEDEPPLIATLAVSVLVAAVAANDRRLTPAVVEALEMLGAFFSTSADDCNPHGMERLFPVDPDGVA